MQLFSYKLYRLLYFSLQHVYLLSIVYLCFILLPGMFYSIFSMFPYFLPCVTALMILAQPSWVRICLNIVFVLRSICLGVFCHVYAQIYLFMCSLSCLCLDLHVYVLLAMLMLRSISLCALCHVHVSRSTYWLLCHVLLQPFYLLLSLFSFFFSMCFGPLGRVQIQILWSRPTSIHLGLY